MQKYNASIFLIKKMKWKKNIIQVTPNWGGYQELEIRSLQIRGCIFSGSPISIAF